MSPLSGAWLRAPARPLARPGFVTAVSAGFVVDVRGHLRGSVDFESRHGREPRRRRGGPEEELP